MIKYMKIEFIKQPLCRNHLHPPEVRQRLIFENQFSSLNLIPCGLQDRLLSFSLRSSPLVAIQHLFGEILWLAST